MDRTTTGIAIAAGLAFLWWKFFRPLTPSVTTSETYDTDVYLQGSTSYPEPIKRVARAIAAAEGYGIPGAIPTVAKNPGDLVLPGWAPTLGNAGIAVFDSADLGWSKLYRQLSIILSGGSSNYFPDTTIEEMGMKWANGDRNWAINVASNLGVATSTPLWQVLA
jgi:hypothetical protein